MKDLDHVKLHFLKSDKKATNHYYCLQTSVRVLRDAIYYTCIWVCTSSPGRFINFPSCSSKRSTYSKSFFHSSAIVTTSPYQWFIEPMKGFWKVKEKKTLSFHFSSPFVEHITGCQQTEFNDVISLLRGWRVVFPENLFLT